MIQVKNLTKRFGERVAVNNISFHIEKGEIVGFMGPNGAGKTTTIRILTCYMPATYGAVTVAGYDVFTQSMDVRREIGYLPESTPLDVHMRAREYLTFRGKIRGLDRSERVAAIKRVADLCWLGDFIDRPIHQLSKGMRQRVGLADALLHDPKVLVLDEPTVGLDPTQIRETRNLIQELALRHTVLLSSHILPEVEATCKRTIIIAGGNIVAAGSPDELKTRIREGSKLIAELTGDSKEITRAVGDLGGVNSVTCASDNGWHRLTIETKKNADPREEIFKLAKEKKWSMRELRLEASTLEEYFVRITAEQAARSKTREAKS